MTRLLKLLPMVVLSIFFMGADTGRQERDERAALWEHQQGLHKKVAALKRERDFLIFQREMYAADSKYLILNITKKRGQLRYKNRTLKDFHITLPRKFSRGTLQPGMLTLTKKIEDTKERFALLFGTSLILQWEREETAKKGQGVPVLSLAEKDMRSVFFAVEQGTLAYILR